MTPSPPPLPNTMPRQLSPSWRARLLVAVVILAAELLPSEATFRVFIRSSELESYFRDTEEFDFIEGDMNYTRGVNHDPLRPRQKVL